MLVPLLVAAFAGSMVAEISESAEKEARQEAVAERIISAEERFADDPFNFIHHICAPLPRTRWADRFWYVGRFVVKEEGRDAVAVECDLLCPTSAKLYARCEETGQVAIFQWDDVESVTVHA